MSSWARDFTDFFLPLVATNLWLHKLRNHIAWAFPSEHKQTMQSNVTTYRWTGVVCGFQQPQRKIYSKCQMATAATGRLEEAWKRQQEMENCMHESTGKQLWKYLYKTIITDEKLMDALECCLHCVHFLSQSSFVLVDTYNWQKKTECFNNRTYAIFICLFRSWSSRGQQTRHLIWLRKIIMLFFGGGGVVSDCGVYFAMRKRLR